MIALATDTFSKPHIAYSSLWPILVVFGAACAGVLIEAFLPRRHRYLAQVAITFAALAIALVGGREEQMRDPDRREVGILAPLFLALVVFGFYPMPLLNVINPYVKDTLQQVGVTDPSPRVQAAPVQGGQQ